jgi:hypothetical protein
MDGGEERFCVFKVSRGDSTPLFQMKKSIFNNMPYFWDRKASARNLALVELLGWLSRELLCRGQSLFPLRHAI